MGPAEGREKIVKRLLVFPGWRFQSWPSLSAASPCAGGCRCLIPMLNRIARLDAVGIVVVILLAGLGQRQQRRFADPIAGRDRRAQGGEHSVAGEPDGHLLIGRQALMATIRVRHAADHQAAVVAPGEVRSTPRSWLLVAKDGGLLKRLIVVDAEHAAGEAVPAESGRRLRAGSSAREYGRRSNKPGSRADSMVLTRAVTPSSLELCQAIGNVIGVLNSTLKS